MDWIVCRLTFQNGLFNLKGAARGFKKAVGDITVTDAHVMKEDPQFAF